MGPNEGGGIDVPVDTVPAVYNKSNVASIADEPVCELIFKDGRWITDERAQEAHQSHHK